MAVQGPQFTPATAAKVPVGPKGPSMPQAQSPDVAALLQSLASQQGAPTAAAPTAPGTAALSFGSKLPSCETLSRVKDFVFNNKVVKTVCEFVSKNTEKIKQFVLKLVHKAPKEV